GSIAEMCGNGVRVFAHYLRASGLEGRDEFTVATLAGPRAVVVHRADDVSADVTVDMGKVNLLGSAGAIVSGRRLTGLSIDVGLGAQTGDLRVEVPGGTLSVQITDTTSFLRGPSVLVARGEIADAWWVAPA
ncbi:MAG: hypothetical protein EBU23_18425, partial [Mycobacteriaceae bacterium]|nr:hypothetical protein [Mycobacteriaceae bacterium]